jgi:hypothetical protein
MPSTGALYSWLDDKPEFAEQYEEAYNDFINEQAEESIHLAMSLDSVPGVKGYNLVQARDKRIMRQLQIAGVRLRKKWGPEAETGGDTIVIEVSGGWNPLPSTALADSPNGQGVEAAKAAERWKAIREGAADA